MFSGVKRAYASVLSAATCKYTSNLLLADEINVTKTNVKSANKNFQ